MDLDVDDEILAQMEADALAAVYKPLGVRDSSSGVQDGSSARSQASTSTQRMSSSTSRPAMLPATRMTTPAPQHAQTSSASTQRRPQNTIPQHSGIVSSQRRSTSTHNYSPLQPILHEDVIVVDIEDDMYVDDSDSDEGKENVPLSARTWAVDDEDVEVIDISD